MRWNTSDMPREKKEFFIFLAVTYGLTFLMAIPMAVLFQMGKDIALFPTAQMLYPAAGLMLAKLLCEREDSLCPKTFFAGFLILTGLAVLWCFSGFFLPEEISLGGSQILMIGGSIVVGILYLGEGKEKQRAYGLKSQNWGRSVGILLLFVALTYGGSAVFSLITVGPAGLEGFLSPDTFRVFLSLPLSFVLSFSCFLGEEYGWRCYFQPLLQRKFGLIKGVFLFGVLWEFWHLPLVFCYYSPMTESMSLVQQLLFRYAINVLMAVFMAYAYGKTHNVWLPVLIHFTNNTLVGAGETDGGTITWAMLGLLVLIKMVSYLPLLRSKVFRAERETPMEVETP